MPHSLANTHRANLRRIPAIVHHQPRSFANAACGTRGDGVRSTTDAARVTCAGCRAGLAVAMIGEAA